MEKNNNGHEDLFMDLDMDTAFLMEQTPGTESELSAADALLMSLRDTGAVDIKRMSAQTGMSVTELISGLKGSIYCNPDKWGGSIECGWETADEYLSGNIRSKLKRARLANRVNNGLFSENVLALENILPREVRAEEIYVTLGSPWVPDDIIRDFVNYIVQPHDDHKCKRVFHDEETGSWEIPNKSIYEQYVRNKVTFGTTRIDAVHILEKTLNMKTIRITDKIPIKSQDAEFEWIVNREETAAAQEKQQLIINTFQKWVWQDEDRKQRLERIYDDRFGSNVLRKFDGRFLDFPGMAADVELYPYQKNAVARILFSPNTLLAHDVGAGKTYIMIAAAMELKRLEMADRNMFVVPNNLVEQWRSIFLRLYPNASILCIEPQNFTRERKKHTLSEITSKNWDGIVIAYSCFDRIPLSREYYIHELKTRIGKLEQARQTRKNVTERQKNREKQLRETLNDLLQETEESQDEIYFDELGIDRLFIDEAHNYKNISVETRINGVYGITRSGSEKSDNLLAKVHYIQRSHLGRGVVMATGTPISNSVSDIYVFQKYLQSGDLELLGLQTFDSWVGMFAEKTSEFEISVDTNTYRITDRFSTFHNLPELTSILASVADFHSIDSREGIPQLNAYTNVVIPKSPELDEYLRSISERADRIHNKMVRPSDDNMLKVTGDGRRAALDIRLVQPSEKSEDDPGITEGSRSKVSECAENVAAIWNRTKEDRLTQLIFCDMSTPKSGFNIYDELKARLIDLGVDEHEIVYVHEADNDVKREVLFRQVRNGEKRVMIGSTFKLGLGVNVQDRLIAVHHLDLPWRPADMVQREGRILRTGNLNPQVEIYRYITEGSFDAYSWQVLETKQRFISDILSCSIEKRQGSDVDNTTLDYAEIKALAIDNPVLRNRVTTQNELTVLSALQRKALENRLRLEQRYQELPKEIMTRQFDFDTCSNDALFVIEQQELEGQDPANERDKKRIASQRRYVRESLASELYRYAFKHNDRSLFEYRGFMIVLPADMDPDYPYVKLIREGIYEVEMGAKEGGLLTRIDNYLDKLDERADMIGKQIEILRQEQVDIENELITGNDYSDKIREHTHMLKQLDKLLEAEKNGNN